MASPKSCQLSLESVLKAQDVKRGTSCKRRDLPGLVKPGPLKCPGSPLHHAAGSLGA